MAEEIRTLNEGEILCLDDILFFGLNDTQQNYGNYGIYHGADNGYLLESIKPHTEELYSIVFKYELNTSGNAQ
jgi:hypothetical protein